MIATRLPLNLSVMTDTLSESEFRAILAPRQMAVVAAVKEINGEADHKPNDKPQPSIARQAQH
jgi:hypothetical protein